MIGVPWKRLWRKAGWRGALAVASVAAISIGLVVGWELGDRVPPDRQTPPIVIQTPPAVHEVPQVAAPVITPPEHSRVIMPDLESPLPVAPTGEGVPRAADAVVPAPQTPSQPGGAVLDWQKHAAIAATPDLPMIAIVIDDMGVDRRRTRRVIDLPGPLTTSFLAYADDLPRQTAAARAGGHELMVHVPMEPLGAYKDPGPDVLTVEQSAEEQRVNLARGLDRFEAFVGINNHMGSRYTSHREGMRVVMEELRRRGLLYLDSLTTPDSVGPELAKAYGVPHAERDVFLDNDLDAALIRKQLVKLETIARKRGYAIAIGHPHDATIQALSEWLPMLHDRGFALVPVSAIVRRRLPAG